MTELNLTESQCFQKEEKIYKIIEIQDHILTNIRFVDIDLKEYSMIQQDFIIEFADVTLIESNYFDQKATENNENKIKENAENYEVILEIRKKFQQFLPHCVV
jgi:hypothetical protein